MRRMLDRRQLLGTAALVTLIMTAPAAAQKKYDEGATDSEIKIGHTNPYSGNLSSHGQIGKTIEAVFKKVNDEGGINGRKIMAAIGTHFWSYADSSEP